MMILESFKLTGKVAIVTGCRTGLGQGIACGLAEAGADIVGVGSTRFQETQKIIEELDSKFMGIRADLRSSKMNQQIIERAVDAFGRVDILVNNAGIIRRSEALDFTPVDWDDVMDLNAKNLFFLSQAAARQMVKQGKGGKIINIASMLSYLGGIRVSSYTASKHAVMGITRILANEWAKHNINVNAIAPGYMVTDNTTSLRQDPVRNKEINARIPAGRWGTPNDLKGTAVFLASSASDYIQGYTIAVDGGWLAR